MKTIESPEDDIEKIKAIIGLKCRLNFVDREEYQLLLKISDQGITLSKKLNYEGFENYLIILKNLERAVSNCLISGPSAQ